MTPFDPIALLAVLLTFYQPASSASLARARVERPEYFAAGTLIGRDGATLRLPDGSSWTLLVDADTGRPHYATTRAGGAAFDAGGDPYFPLEPGPLQPIDIDAIPRPVFDDVFQPLVADALDPLSPLHETIDSGHTEISEHADAAPFADEFEATIPGAAGALDEESGQLYDALPADVAQATNEQSGVIDENDAEQDDEPPPEMDTEPPPYEIEEPVWQITGSGGGGGGGGSDSTPTYAYVHGQIQLMYETLLGREPDQLGWDLFTDAVMTGGQTLIWVQEQIIASDEYKALHGGV